jgi:hypothetical protein
MHAHLGKITEIRLDLLGRPQAWIACRTSAIPGAGQYLRAYLPGDENQSLPLPLFPTAIHENGFLAAPPVPTHWLPGMPLQLLGPLGSGFHLGSGVRRLALAALDETPDRLLPLVTLALEQNADVTFYLDCPAPFPPASVEVSPLSALPEALGWADFLALDLPLQSLPGLRQRLGMHPEERLTIPAQGLVNTLMPCAGMAECGACAVPLRRGWQLACVDGPVFDLNILEW